MLTAPANLQAAFDPSAQAVADLVSEVRRTSPVVVLDVPHAWNAWVKQVLIGADEVIVVAGPDLASLRNAEHMLHVLRAARGAAVEPHVVLSMTGVPKRPEIPLRDFSDTLATAPIASFVFEPDVFGVAEMARQPLGLSAPRSKATAAIDALATMLTGRGAAERKRAPLTKMARAARPPEPPMSATPVEAEAVSAPAPVHDLPPIEITAFEPPAEKREPASGARPFTFRAEPSMLELVHKAPALEEEALAKARDAAIVEVAQVQAKHIRRGRPGLIRAVACVIALIAAGMVYFQNQREASAAAPVRVTERATPTIAPMAPSVATAPPTAITPEQRYEAALQALGAGQLEQGITALSDVAETGYAPAQYRLAKLYENGEGVPTDLTLARQWAERAASGGDHRAMHDLGVFFARGEGAPQDDVAAFRWFRQAAEYGVLDSQYNLGVFYEEGRGVSADAGEALFWFLVAGRAGDLSAIQRANTLEAQVSPMAVDHAHARAIAFRARQAQP
jgi:TPR repeat protein